MKKFISLCLALPALATALHADNSTPTGSLTAPTSVPEGTQAKIAWNIVLPDGGANITDQDTLEPLQKSKIEVRCIGAGYWGGTKTVKLQMKINNKTYQLFDNKAKYFTSGTILAENITVKTTDKINFGMMGVSNQSGKYYRWSDTPRTDPDHSFIALANGDDFPNYTPMGSDGDVDSYLRPYLNDDSNTVSIGPKDVIFIAELDRRYTYEQSGDPADKGYDMQDMVFLVSFIPIGNN
ncbi:hypothetical protein [Persicirhabdus sediminis]|uniref:DUF4114 domain-containing protein n=1 Tax=Persicirhabdus sediminis TaxID=454144 RepID=A0A8J7MCR9_9BACT|nr:hypothetical protein [Persicirhabdus sediminis]MBK1790183.1 hypothetical protein [Persicirhabdus sediminis]